jgi:hypothetical protein
VSVFRPSASVADPHGRDWEIYSFRVKVPERGALDPLASDDLSATRAAGLMFPFFLLTLPFLLLSALLRALVRLFVDFPLAGIRALRTDEWTIEAISWAPFQSRYTWSTTREYRGQVLAQVEGGLARGEIPHPRNAHLVRAV